MYLDRRSIALVNMSKLIKGEATPTFHIYIFMHSSSCVC